MICFIIHSCYLANAPHSRQEMKTWTNKTSWIPESIKKAGKRFVTAVYSPHLNVWDTGPKSKRLGRSVEFSKIPTYTFQGAELGK